MNCWSIASFLISKINLGLLLTTNTSFLLIALTESFIFRWPLQNTPKASKIIIFFWNNVYLKEIWADCVYSEIILLDRNFQLKSRLVFFLSNKFLGKSKFWKTYILILIVYIAFQWSKILFCPFVRANTAVGHCLPNFNSIEFR